MEKEPNQNEGSHGILNERINGLNNLLEANSKHASELIFQSNDYEEKLRSAETKRIDEKFESVMLNASQRFDAQQLALKDALMAQEKQTALALINTEKAIDKADINTDKRFTQLGDKITEAVDSINKSTGAQGIYVTHTDLSTEMGKLRTDFEVMIRPVVTYMNNNQGQQKGAGTSWQTIVTIISVAGMLIGIFFAFTS